MGRYLIADSGSDQVGAVRIKALLHQEIDLTQVDYAQVDRQFLRFTDPGPGIQCVGHLYTIH
jgi:hypothetical protein